MHTLMFCAIAKRSHEIHCWNQLHIYYLLQAFKCDTKLRIKFRSTLMQIWCERNNVIVDNHALQTNRRRNDLNLQNMNKAVVI